MLFGNFFRVGSNESNCNWASNTYYGDASGLKIVKSFKRVGKGYNKPKSKINNAVDMKSLKESSRFSGHVQTSSEEEMAVVTKKRGRPKGSKNKAPEVPVVTEKGRGRPRRSKS